MPVTLTTKRTKTGGKHPFGRMSVPTVTSGKVRLQERLSFVLAAGQGATLLHDQTEVARRVFRGTGTRFDLSVLEQGNA